MGVLQISSQTGMIDWGQKSKPKEIPWASNKTTPKIPGQNFTPKKSHAEFPSHKNFQKAFKKTRKMETSVWIPKKLPPKNTYQNFATQKKIPKWKISNPKKSFDHPCHLKSGVPPSGAREICYKSRKPVITSKQYFKGCLSSLTSGVYSNVCHHESLDNSLQYLSFFLFLASKKKLVGHKQISVKWIFGIHYRWACFQNAAFRWGKRARKCSFFPQIFRKRRLRLHHSCKHVQTYPSPQTKNSSNPFRIRIFLFLSYSQ